MTQILHFTCLNGEPKLCQAASPRQLGRFKSHSSRSRKRLFATNLVRRGANQAFARPLVDPDPNRIL